MRKNKEHCKITLGMLKGKSITTSVPSISIKFHANAEQIEELYASEDEGNPSGEKIEKAHSPGSSPLNIDPDSSHLKLFPKLGKRSTSIDVNNTQHLDASPPSDPWRFFSDIKGKITKSVEEKITEIKSRSHEEGSPQHKAKTELKTVQDGKESSSVSDSEDLSESSISKTCGVISTTEGVEMSSDEDTPSLEKDKKLEKPLSRSPSNSLRHRFRFLRQKVPTEEGTVKEKDLSKIYNINAEKNEEVLREDSEDVESAVDALEETGLKNDSSDCKSKVSNNPDVLKYVTEKIDNIEIDDDKVIHIKEVTGKEIRETYFDCQEDKPKTVFAPTGFVDLRPLIIKSHPFCYNYLHMIIIFLSITIYVIVQYYSPYTAGLAAGMIVSFAIFQLYVKLSMATVAVPVKTPSTPSASSNILEIQAVKEYQPLQKYEGWINEYPDVYNPETYHISHTQSVFLRLQGNLLRISHLKTKIPKRAMWNEAEIHATFTNHRIYNLLGAKISLLPQGLAKKRQWSKKYPICITLPIDQMCFDSDVLSKLESEDEKYIEKDKNSDKKKPTNSPKDKRNFRFRKKEYPMMAQRFSKLTEDDGFDLDSDSRASTPSVENSDLIDSPIEVDEDIFNNEKSVEEFNNLPGDDFAVTSSTQDTNSDELKIFLFGRTDREKEDWFRRFVTATHKDVAIITTDSVDPDIKETVVDALLEASQTELEYLKYMNMFKSPKKISKSTESDLQVDLDTSQDEDVHLWLNALIGRVFFDCARDPTFINRVKDRIERKLSTIKLPYFIEEILVPEMSLGKTSPCIRRAGKPVMDDRGLWIDLDVTYEGLIVLTLQTKLNLMRLKNPQAYEKPASRARSAIYHSDVDDSAESSSDEERPQEIQVVQDPTSIPTGSSSSGHSGKKLIKMVDKIAESKFFQAATENRYIKKAMEGVSNTDLRLTVEVRSIEGTLVLNIPPPPSDRIWLGFRPLPDITLTARPIVGERHLSYIMVTSWIEKKLLLEFQKIMVIPNMEDFVIPVMNPKLPE